MIGRCIKGQRVLWRLYGRVVIYFFYTVPFVLFPPISAVDFNHFYVLCVPQVRVLALFALFTLSNFLITCLLH